VRSGDGTGGAGEATQWLLAILRADHVGVENLANLDKLPPARRHRRARPDPVEGGLGRPRPRVRDDLRGSLRRMELIHTCYRIGDIDRSVEFYEALGFEERRRMPIRDEAINVFMGLPGDGDRLELTYNHGVGSYELGTGYNHIALTVDDLDGTLSELAGKGIDPEKPPYRVREGGNRICFVRDPDGYRIELIEKS
jgi:lactoylglutathione lyase